VGDQYGELPSGHDAPEREGVAFAERENLPPVGIITGGDDGAVWEDGPRA
jgi:hypothetical protein